MNWSQRVIAGVGLLCLVLVACSSKSAEAPLTAQQQEVKTRLDMQMAEAGKTQQAYHAMDGAALLGKLMEQSKARIAPFNSPAYRELKGRADLDSKPLVALVTQNGNADGLLPLLLLRTRDPQSYLSVPVELRVAILSDALAASRYFNAWGLPGFYQQDASRSIIETGAAAVPALKRLLADTRPAPVFGSQEYMIYQRYKFRVCDYALYFVDAIKGTAKAPVPESSQARDELIRAAQA
jgi:hypothetical protein